MTVGELTKLLEGFDSGKHVFLDRDHNGAVLTEIDEVTLARGHVLRQNGVKEHGLKFDHTGPVEYVLLRPKND